MTGNNKTLFAALIVLALIVGGASFLLFKKKADTTTPAPGIVASETMSADEPAPAIADAEEAEAEQAAPAAAVAEDTGDLLTPRTLGNPDAPVKIEEFASLTCSHCAHFHNDTFATLKKDYIDTGIVHLTFTDFPLNAPALQASMVARCMPADRYFNFLSLLFKTQDQWAFEHDPRKILRQNAKLAGMSDEAFDACLANDKLKEHIATAMRVKAEKYQVNSTPSFVFNDGKAVLTGAQSIEAFAAQIDALKK